jgi:hypothetical protein
MTPDEALVAKAMPRAITVFAELGRLGATVRISLETG